MKINSNNISFTGYDARPLKGIFARDLFDARSYAESGGCTKDFYKTLNELSKVSDQESFDVFVQNSIGIYSVKDFDKLSKVTSITSKNIPIWTQDNIEFVSDKKFLINSLDYGKFLEKLLKLKCDKAVVQGGNFFIVNNGKKDVIILGKNSAEYINDLKAKTNIDDVYLISQPDFHIDLGIRPLNNKNILINDFNGMLKILKKYLQNSLNYLLYNPQNQYVKKFSENIKEIITKHENSIKFKNYVDADKISEELSNYGFNPIKVPAAIVSVCEYDLPYEEKFVSRKYSANFINAIVHERQDKSLVYLTNNYVDRICPDNESKIGARLVGFDLKKNFEKAVKDYINPADIHYFSMQDLLEQKSGGIHCIFSEIPKNL